MSGRHRAPRKGRYTARHRAPVRHTGVFSVAGIIVVAAVGGVSASYALTRQSPAHPSSLHAAASVSGSPTPTTAVSATPGDTAATSPSPAAAASGRSGRADRRAARRSPRGNRPAATVVLHTLNGPCWVGATTIDGRQLVAQTLPPHHRLVLSARHVHITLGNAGAIVVHIRHHQPHRAGRLGQVTSFTL